MTSYHVMIAVNEYFFILGCLDVAKANHVQTLTSTLYKTFTLIKVIRKKMKVLSYHEDHRH